MKGDVCKIDGCVNIVVNAGKVCNWHRYAKRKYGTYDAQKIGHKVPHKKSRIHDLINTRKNTFYSMVCLPDDGGCMIWMGSKNKKGYGQISMNGIPMLAHRFSYKLHFGNFDNNLCVLHKCDNPSCVAPNHLFLGTKKDNMQDCLTKNRLKTPNLKGQENSSSKILDLEIPMIRKKLSLGLSCKFIGDFYGVSQDAIRCIKNGKNWRHIGE